MRRQGAKPLAGKLGSDRSRCHGPHVVIATLITKSPAVNRRSPPRVDAARVRALRAANVELMGVYWHIGRHIAEQQDAAPVKRGHAAPKIIERLSADLRAAYPDATGFSVRNLTYMRDFSRAWTEKSILQRGVARLPWGSIIELLGIRDPEVRAWSSTITPSAASCQ